MPFSFTPKVDGVDTIAAIDVNELQTAITALGVTTDFVGSGTYAARPASIANNAGRIYLPTDKPVICRDTGAGWVEWETDTGSPLALPNSGSFSWVNQGGASIATVNGRDVLTSPSGSVIRGRSVASSNPMTITARLVLACPVGGNSEAGLFIGDGTKFVTWAAFTTFGGGAMRTAKWTSNSVYSANYSQRTPMEGYSSVPNWLRITDDGTNFLFYLSQNGIDWVLFDTRARLNWLTTGPTICGYYISNQSGKTGDIVCYSWSKV